MINANSAVPLYSQIKDDILSQINDGTLAPGSRLASEKEMTKHYGVSMITIRRAVTELVEEHVLERKQGKGTFVLQRSFHRGFHRVGRGFSEICAANGMKATTLVLEARVLDNPPEEILDRLEIRNRSSVVYIRRLRYADQQPVVIETTYFPMEYAYLLDLDLNHESMYNALRDHEVNFCPCSVFGQRRIRLIKADKETAELLKIKTNSTILYFDSLVVNGENGKPIHISNDIGYAQKYNFTLLI